MTEFDELPILLIEDNEIDVIAFRRGMQKLGLNNPLRVAQQGRKALQLLRGQNETQTITLPALIFLDINMPIMDGHGFLASLREDQQLRSCIVFMLTTSNHREDVRRAYERNVAGYIVKQDVGKNFEKLWKMVRSYFEVVTLPSGSAS
ncbi:MAG: response regulator [Planctomycetota bacterium]